MQDGNEGKEGETSVGVRSHRRRVYSVRSSIEGMSMSAGRMHVDEVNTDASLVGRLIAAQFPQWGNLLIEPVHSAGHRQRDLPAR